jgi:primosomal protein N' (replication factor Y)
VPDCVPSDKYQGAGTQTVEQELLDTFPGVTVARKDSDTMTKREAYEDVLDRCARGEVKVLLGTQMIAKGLHFPEVTLVGVVSADTALQVPDFRAAERTFALLAQVAAARYGDEAQVVVRRCCPTRRRSLATEQYRRSRRRARAGRVRLPPFRRLVRVVLRGKDPAAVDERGHALAARLSAAAIDGVEYLGPATPPIARMAGFFRRHLLIKATTPTGARRAVEVLRATEPAHRGVEEQIDVDPVGML